MKHKYSDAWFGYEDRKTGARSGVALSEYAGRKYKKAGVRNGKKVDEDDRYRMYYFATEAAFAQWQKKRVAK